MAKVGISVAQDLGKVLIMFMAVAGFSGAAKGKGSMLRRKMTTYHSVLLHEPGGVDDAVEAGYVHL